MNQSPYYLRARYYDPGIGRFLTRDPFVGFSTIPQSLNRYPYVQSNPASLIDPYGLCGWKDPWTCVGEGVNKASDIAYDLMPENAQFLFDWVTGTGSGDRTYGPDSAQVRGMQGSAAGRTIRDEFVANGCQTTDIHYGTLRAFLDTWLHPHPLNPMFQVGGFAGASSATRVPSDSKEGNDMMRVHIENEAGLNSFSYHILPNSPLDWGPFRTITQTFDWEDPLPAACQN